MFEKWNNYFADLLVAEIFPNAVAGEYDQMIVLAESEFLLIGLAGAT